MTLVFRCLTNFIFKHYLTFTHSILTVGFLTTAEAAACCTSFVPNRNYSERYWTLSAAHLFQQWCFKMPGWLIPKRSRGIVEVVYAFDTSLICCWPMRRDKQAATHSCCAETAKLQTSQDRHEGVTYWDPLDTKLLITHQQHEFNSTSWKQTKAVYSVARSFTITRNQRSENKVTAHNNNKYLCDFL